MDDQSCFAQPIKGEEEKVFGEAYRRGAGRWLAQTALRNRLKAHRPLPGLLRHPAPTIADAQHPRVVLSGLERVEHLAHLDDRGLG